jgi:hypothetical protein
MRGSLHGEKTDDLRALDRDAGVSGTDHERPVKVAKGNDTRLGSGY